MGLVVEIPSITASNLAAARNLGVATLSELKTQCEANPSESVIEGLIPTASVNIAVGDSGLGKTPCAYQMGLAVAAGVQFLGFPTKKSRILYIDLENGRDQIVSLGSSLCRHLNLTRFPDEHFGVVTECNLSSLSLIVETLRPGLVIVDTLRAFFPGAEDENSKAAEMLGKLRLLAKKYDTAFLVLHHLRKPSKEGRPLIENTPPMTWLLEASGARALINQTDVRIGFDAPTVNSEISLVLRGHAKLQGEVGPIYLERVLDEHGEATGYRRVSAVALLSDPHQIATFNSLPAEFIFKEAGIKYQRTSDPTNKFLKKCIGLGILEKSDGFYRKISGHDK